MIVGFRDTTGGWYNCWNVKEEIVKECPMVGVDLYLTDTGEEKTAEEL